MQGRVRRALVTGASSGIGAAFARHLADRGVGLVLVARREDRLRQLADALPTPVEVLPADLGDPAELARVEARLGTTDEPVDLLVNNAGAGVYGPFAAQPVDRQVDLVELNALAVLRCCRAVLPRLLAQGDGGIINVGSLAGVQPDPYAATYGATKAFVRSLSQALHEEVRDRGVTVTLVTPGLTATAFADAAEGRAPMVSDRLVMSADAVVTSALRDFARGRARSVPGVGNRIVASAAALAPRGVTRRVSATLHRRMADT
ncbi:SDR family NAD(P)-dependent oxidoreductase [Egicoccus sp. AB-alg2]|uniref:SDR family NAD(P)-dependent oxidoreductase n=1 Tax=Egicoccus sp. AB-alg2 TaxID=3242693 RepID=UPI00359EF75B